MVSHSKKNKKITSRKSFELKETNELLKKLISIEKKQNKLIEELLELLKTNQNITEIRKENINLDVKASLKPVTKNFNSENGITRMEREITLDIPSLIIKDKFKLEEEVEEKVKKFDKHKKGFSLFRRKKREDEKEKLKKLSLENLKKLIQIHDERKQIVGISYILRQFLEIKFRIPHTLTYSKIINEIKDRKIDEELKVKLINFFSKLLEEIYKGEKLDISTDYAFKLANQVVQELSKYNKIEKIKK